MKLTQQLSMFLNLQLQNHPVVEVAEVAEAVLQNKPLFTSRL
jgi:hypothetical protein